MIDTTTEAGATAVERLGRELIAWLTTVTPDGQPQTSAVWFLWRDGEFLVYSLAKTSRVRNIEANPRISIHLSGDAEASDVLTMEGEARIDREAAGPASVPEMIAKYRHLIDQYGWTVERYSADYPLAIRIRPTRIRFG